MPTEKEAKVLWLDLWHSVVVENLGGPGHEIAEFSALKTVCGMDAEKTCELLHKTWQLLQLR